MDDHATDVAVVMIVRNGSRFLGGAIESVLAQTRAPTEILVVDGGSHDDTADVARRYGVSITCQVATGIADARNQGVAATTSPLVAFLDHDDRWPDDKLERQIDALAADPAAGYSTTMVRPVRADVDIALHPTLERQLTRGTVAGLTPSTLLVRRTTLRDAGTFDTSLGIGADTDWFARVRDLGIGCAHLTDVAVDKLLHDQNASIDVASTRSDLLKVVAASVRRKRGNASAATI